MQFILGAVKLNEMIVHAPNVHHGGGRVLLLNLLTEACKEISVAVVDARLDAPFCGEDIICVRSIPPSMLCRLMAEWRLRSSADSSDIVLCFGNLPPLFGCRARVFVYLQNRYLLGSSSKHLGLWGRARIFVERLWIRCRLGNAELVVQTDSMAREVRKFLGRDSHVIPFAPICRREHPEGSPKYDFVYVASGEPHKNHRNLVAAWIELATSDLRPSLALTLDRARHPQLVNWIESMSRKHGLLIDNLGHLSGESVAQLYARSRALVYPSRFESFGLPLVEANHAGLEILAPEADYVRDVVEPVETFDPESPVSICRAVRRYLGRPQAPQRVLSPGEFVARILGPNFRP